MDKKSLVSVLVCAYNAERFIENCVRSVWDQTYKNIELLILDNASTDRTIQKLQALQNISPIDMRVISHGSNVGPYAGLNLLLDQAAGKYSAILDHDDFWHRDKIHKQIEFLDKHPEYAGCGAQTYLWWEKTGKVSLFRAKEIDSLAYHGTLVFRNIHEWRYDPSLVYRTDIHFMQDVLCAKGRRLYNLQVPLAVWRIRADGKNYSRQWNSLKRLVDYWRRTGKNLELMKGLLQLILPALLFDNLLRARYSLSELSVGSLALKDFSPPFGPTKSTDNEQV